MKIKLNNSEIIVNLPNIIKIPALINFKIQDHSVDIYRHNLCDFGWNETIEENLLGNDGKGADLWCNLYEGIEVEIPLEIERYWLSLISDNKNLLHIDKIEYKDNIYKAEVNGKKVTIEIKYDE